MGWRTVSVGGLLHDRSTVKSQISLEQEHDIASDYGRGLLFTKLIISFRSAAIAANGEWHC